MNLSKYDFPKVLMDCMVEFPYFTDFVKDQLLTYEMGGELWNPGTRYISSMLSAALYQQRKKVYNLWFCAYLSPNDLHDLTFAIKNNKILVFPGIIFLYSSLNKAIAN